MYLAILRKQLHGVYKCPSATFHLKKEAEGRNFKTHRSLSMWYEYCSQGPRKVAQCMIEPVEGCKETERVEGCKETERVGRKVCSAVQRTPRVVASPPDTPPVLQCTEQVQLRSPPPHLN